MSALETVVGALCLDVARAFYRELHVVGRAHIPRAGPCIVVANHPNGLVDPMLLRRGLNKPVAFVAKSTLFENPLGKLAMAAFAAIPAYRSQDGQDTRKNQQTFDLCDRHLRGFGWLALFPEGKSHSQLKLEPLKTGAARIALRAAKAMDRPLAVLPVGIAYDAKDTFRSRAALVVGPPLDADAYLRHHGDGPEAVKAFTARIEEALSDVMLQADSQELWRGLLAVAAWTFPGAEGSIHPTLGAIEPRARELARTFREIRTSDPDRAEAIVASVRHFVRELESVGLDDPLALERKPPSPKRIVRAVLPLVGLAPLALLGALLGWLPYRLIRPLAGVIARGETDLVSTVKLLLALVVLPLWYAGLALAVGLAVDSDLGWATLALGPFTGFVALKWAERLALRKAALRAAWLKWQEPEVAGQIRVRRAELVTLVEAELGR